MRKLLVVGLIACVVAEDLSTASAQSELRGSDALENVTKDAIGALVANGTIAAGALVYVGGGSSAGEGGMIAGTQHIAPMARQIADIANGYTFDGADFLHYCTPSASQLLIGLDGISVVAANHLLRDSLEVSASTTDDCPDGISGKTVTGIYKADGVTPCDAATDGCTTAGQYSFADWRDVLAIIYGGLNHNSGPVILEADGTSDCDYQLPPLENSNDQGQCATSTTGQVCYPAAPQDAIHHTGRCGVRALVGRRNPGRANCLSPVRQALVDRYGEIFSDAAGAPSCRTGTCTKLKHAFRLDDQSGTSDTFAALIGLPPIAPYTRAYVSAPGGAIGNGTPIPDRFATANPFCNAGERPMNRGDADYLDLDPIRRAVDWFADSSQALNRFGLEQVGEYYGKTFGGNNNDANCNTDLDASVLGVQPPIPEDHASSTEPGVWPDPTIPGSTALLQADLGSNGTSGALSSPTATTRQCLGLVLPISLPDSFGTVSRAYFGDSASGQPIACDAVAQDGVSLAFAPVTPDGQHPGTALCPNGLPQPCMLPYHFDPTLAFPYYNFNCISDRISPAPAAVGYSQDRRALNLHPVDSTGHYVRDHYRNPFIPIGSGGISATRQTRVVSAYYRIHTTRTTNLHGSSPTGGPCTAFSSSVQIGCLVKASTCSIGLASREAVDGFPRHNLAFRLDGISASAANLQSLLTGSSPVYPMARALWLSSIAGFSSGTLNGDEFELMSFESTPSSIDPIIQSHNFVTVPGGVSRLRSCPGLP